MRGSRVQILPGAFANFLNNRVQQKLRGEQPQTVSETTKINFLGHRKSLISSEFMKLITLEDKLAEESKRIARNARVLHEQKQLTKPFYLSRSSVKKEIDIVNSSIETINDYIDKKKKAGKFYLFGVFSNDINPRKLVLPSLQDFIFSTLFYRMVSSLGDVKIKKEIYRKLGMSIGENVHIYQGVKFDVIFSKLIEIGNNSTIGGESVFYSHTAVAAEDYFGWGITKIGKNCTVGDRCFIAGIKMGDNSRLKPGSVIAGYQITIPPNEEWGGNPAEFRRHI